jgi:hypothetical protein
VVSDAEPVERLRVAPDAMGHPPEPGGFPPGTQMVTLVGKLKPVATGTGGFGRPSVKETFIILPPLLAGPQLVRGALQTIWMSSKYAVPSGAKAIPNGL